MKTTTYNDRRIRKTEKALQEAFIKLLVDKKQKVITVQNLIEEADISRGTFYNHYIDIPMFTESLKHENLAQFKGMILEISDHEWGVDVSCPFEKYFMFWQKHARIRTALLIYYGNEFAVEMLDCANLTIHERWTDTRKTDFHMHTYNVHGLVGMTSQWIKSGMKETPSEMATKMRKILDIFINNVY